MRAKSIKGNSPAEIQAALNQSIADGFKPTLAIVFISIKQDRNAVCELLRNARVDIVGATSSGEFINGYQGNGSIVVLLLELNRNVYSILYEDIGERNLYHVAEQMATAAMKKFNHPAIILCSTFNSAKGEFLDGAGLIRSLEKVLGTSVPIYGGMAGDDISFTGGFVFANERSGDKAIAALVLDEDKISVQGMAISGWKALGISRTVTETRDGWIFTIDDQPALEMYLKYLGKENVSGDEKYKLFEEIGVYYPFQVEGLDDPLMRTPIMVNKEAGSFKMDFDVPQGTHLRFSMPPDFDIVETILEKANEFKNTKHAEAEALLIFSCSGRLSALGPMTNMENEGLAEIWKAPMAGYFTYGEYGTSNGRQHFHSTTLSWVALKEK